MLERTTSSEAALLPVSRDAPAAALVGPPDCPASSPNVHIVRAREALARDLEGRQSSRAGGAAATGRDWYAVRADRRYAPKPAATADGATLGGGLRCQLAPYTTAAADVDAIEASIAYARLGGGLVAGGSAMLAVPGVVTAESARCEHAGPIEAPRRVLDVGCGIAAPFCIAAAQEPGWKAAEIVGASCGEA